MFEKLVLIFGAVFDTQDSAIITNLRRVSEPKWDSLTTVSLVSAIEGEFGITLESTDIARIHSFRTTSSLLAEKIK